MTLVSRTRETPYEIKLNQLAFYSLCFLTTLGEKHEGEDYYILVNKATFEALESERYPDESHTDCVLRLARKGDPSQILQPPVQRMRVTLEEAMHFGVMPILRVISRNARRKHKTFEVEKWWVEIHPKIAKQIEYRRKLLAEEAALEEIELKIEAKKNLALKKGIDS